MIRRPPRSTQSRSSAASDVYKRQVEITLVQCSLRLLLAVHRVLVGLLPCEFRVHVVDVLGGHAHVEGARVNQLLRDEARVRVRPLSHRVVPHVLDTARDDDIGHAEPDIADAVVYRGHRAGAHAVDGVARHRNGQSGECGARAADRETLIPVLGRCRPDVVVDQSGIDIGVPVQKCPDDLYHHVVSPGVREGAIRPCLAEGGTAGIDEIDVLYLFPHTDSSFYRVVTGALSTIARGCLKPGRACARSFKWDFAIKKNITSGSQFSNQYFAEVMTLRRGG